MLRVAEANGVTGRVALQDDAAPAEAEAPHDPRYDEAYEEHGRDLHDRCGWFH